MAARSTLSLVFVLRQRSPDTLSLSPPAGTTDVGQNGVYRAWPSIYERFPQVPQRYPESRVFETRAIDLDHWCITYIQRGSSREPRGRTLFLPWELKHHEHLEDSYERVCYEGKSQETVMSAGLNQRGELPPSGKARLFRRRLDSVSASAVTPQRTMRVPIMRE